LFDASLVCTCIKSSLMYYSGGPFGSYSNNEIREWIVSCPSGGYTNLAVNYLDLENNFDFLSIYHGNNTSGPLLFRGTGFYGRNAWSMYLSKSPLYVLFTSDSRGTGEGFEIVWSCAEGGVFVSCEAGTYSSIIGATNSSACLPCSVGTYSSSGSSACSICESGMIKILNLHQCYILIYSESFIQQPSIFRLLFTPHELYKFQLIYVFLRYNFRSEVYYMYRHHLSGNWHCWNCRAM
jgi:hypothetical protein